VSSCQLRCRDREACRLASDRQHTHAQNVTSYVTIRARSNDNELYERFMFRCKMQPYKLTHEDTWRFTDVGDVEDVTNGTADALEN